MVNSMGNCVNTSFSRELLRSACQWYGVASGVCRDSTPTLPSPPLSLVLLAETSYMSLWPSASTSAGFHGSTVLFGGSPWLIAVRSLLGGGSPL